MHYPAVLQNDFDPIENLLFFQNWFGPPLLQKAQNLLIRLFLFTIGLEPVLFLLPEPLLQGGLALVGIF
jgi:hypothetical protein